LSNMPCAVNSAISACIGMGVFCLDNAPAKISELRSEIN